MHTALCSLQKNVTKLVMNNMYLWGPAQFGLKLNHTTTKCFKTVSWVNMDENNIYLITVGAVLNLRHLTYISLKRNNIVGDPLGLFYLPFMNNLTYLDMSDQSDRDSNLFARKNRKVFNLDLSFNITVSILPHLDTLKLDFTNGQIFKHLNFTRRWVCFKNNVLTRFEVTYVKFQSVDGTIPCFNKLKHLDIRGLRTKVLDPYLLTEMPALETLLAGRAIPVGFLIDQMHQYYFIKILSLNA